LLISVSVDEGVPPWLAGRGKGWLTAEYAMHPRCNPGRKSRDGRKGRVDGRSTEIQRLIGRSLRAAVAMEKLGERMLTVDCDVLDADGGTRTAAITGGYVGLVLALDLLRRKGLVEPGVLRAPLSAISVGFINGRPLLDLNYEEDSSADVDLNVVATADGSIVEVQGTAEGEPVAKDKFDAMLELALVGTKKLQAEQERTLSQAGIGWERLLAG
jgi:ribonuclease PH